MDIPEKVTGKINSYNDWRSEVLSDLRMLINEAAPELNEDYKWDVPVWTHNGLVCAISGFKDHVKFNFFKGAYLTDPNNLFNSGLDSKEHRSVNFTKDGSINKIALKELIYSAVAYNKEA